MRAVVQRVTGCTITVEGNIHGSCDSGLLVYLGVESGDEETDARYLAEKIIGLRIFEDDDGKMNRSLIEAGGQMCVVSQFTLLADTRKGRRPSFVKAADPSVAEGLYMTFVHYVREKSVQTETGAFGQHMNVTYTNDGPVTILLDSQKLF